MQNVCLRAFEFKYLVCSLPTLYIFSKIQELSLHILKIENLSTDLN